MQNWHIRTKIQKECKRKNAVCFSVMLICLLHIYINTTSYIYRKFRSREHLCAVYFRGRSSRRDGGRYWNRYALRCWSVLYFTDKVLILILDSAFINITSVLVMVTRMEEDASAIVEIRLYKNSFYCLQLSLKKLVVR